SQSGTWNIGSITTLPALAAGANTIGAVTQASGPWTNNITQVGGSAVTLGQKTMSAAIPVVLASDESAHPVTQSGTWNVGQSGAPWSVTGSGGTFPVTGTTSNAGSAVATSVTNLPSVVYNYGFNGTTWDQLQVDGSKSLKVNCITGCSSSGG